MMSRYIKRTCPSCGREFTLTRKEKQTRWFLITPRRWWQRIPFFCTRCSERVEADRDEKEDCMEEILKEWER